MGFKITTKTLRSIILQEIKKITEGTHGDTPEEDSEDEYEDDYVAPIERPGYLVMRKRSRRRNLMGFLAGQRPKVSTRMIGNN